MVLFGIDAAKKIFKLSIFENQYNMKRIIIYYLAMLVFVVACSKEEENTVEALNCECTNPIKEKDIAWQMLIGEWTWVSTATKSKLNQGGHSLTPSNTNDQISYIFSADTLTIVKNGLKIYKEQYAVGYFGEYNSTPSDSTLVVKYLSNMQIADVSILRIDNDCMQLINSYDDAGGDIKLKKK